MRAKAKHYVLLHGSLLLYSFAAVFSKLAGEHPLFSWPFILLYGTSLAILFAYAILWQQVLKRFPLTVAFANKAIVLLWGLLWGILLWQETVTPGMVVGIIVIALGILLVVNANE